MELAAGARASVGRLASENQLSVPDRFLAPTQFSIEYGAERCVVRDVSAPPKRHVYCQASGCFLASLRNTACSAKVCAINDLSAAGGVYVNGKKVLHAALDTGDIIAAAGSAFRFELGPPAPPEPARPAKVLRLALTAEQHAQAVAFFAAQRQPIFAIVDAARSPAALSALVTHSELYYSLYDGPEGEQLADVAPYLVALPPRSALLATLLRNHWGDSRFTLIFADTDFKSVRRQLRRFLMVEDERNKKMYFRFYDPRVLRIFLPTCTPEECLDFFGPIAWFVLETEQPGLAQAFSYKQGNLLRSESIQF